MAVIRRSLRGPCFLMGGVAAGVAAAWAFSKTERERRENYRKLKALKEELELRVQERTRQLAAANKELESFSYSVSHDLRAPLRSITGFSALLSEDLKGRLSAADREYLERIQGATERMGRLIDALLRLSRVSRAELRRREVDLSALARDVLDSLAKTEPGRKVRVTVAPGLSARADPELLRAAVSNLLENAWKFTSRREDASIEVGRAATPRGEAFFIRDNGAGFDMAFVKKLFNPFQRLHGPAEFPGSGVGLATVQRIVVRHGGAVWAEAQPGRGATFYFQLPGAGR